MFYERDEHLSKIREHSAYPIYRKFVHMLCILAYVLIGIFILIGLVSAFSAESPSSALIGIALGSIIAAVAVLWVLLLQEVALMLVDAVDSTLVNNAHNLETLENETNPPLAEKTLTREREPRPQPTEETKPEAKEPEAPAPKPRLVDDSVREEYRKSQEA